MDNAGNTRPGLDQAGEPVATEVRSADADRALREAVVEHLYHDYSQEAQRIGRTPIGCWNWSLGLLLIVIGGVVLFGAPGVSAMLQGNIVAGLILIVLGLPITLLGLWMIRDLLTRKPKMTTQVAAVAAQKPGFEEFYAEWVKLQQAEKPMELRRDALLPLFTRGAASAAVEAALRDEELRQRVLQQTHG